MEEGGVLVVVEGEVLVLFFLEEATMSEVRL